MFLPQFMYKLCKEYMKTPNEQIKRFKPVEVSQSFMVSI
jgi:hypothetical protein